MTSVTTSSDPSTSSDSSTIPDNIQERRREIQAFIRQHFGSQRSFCKAMGLKPARVSKALQDRYISNRRLLPLEYAINQWRVQHLGEPKIEDLTAPVYRLKGGRLLPGESREPVGHRAVSDAVDRDLLAYVDVTVNHHAVVELVDAFGLLIEDVELGRPSTSVEYAALVNQQWTYVNVTFDDRGRPHLPRKLDGEADNVRLFGRAVLTIRPR